MSFEMTATEAQQYGDRLSIWEKIALLNSFAPLIGYAQRFTQEPDPFKKGLIVADACEWMASRTSSVTDDQLVKHVAAVLRTPEGEALVRWCLMQVEAIRA